MDAVHSLHYRQCSNLRCVCSLHATSSAMTSLSLCLCLRTIKEQTQRRAFAFEADISNEQGHCWSYTVSVIFSKLPIQAGSMLPAVVSCKVFCTEKQSKSRLVAYRNRWMGIKTYRSFLQQKWNVCACACDSCSDVQMSPCAFRFPSSPFFTSEARLPLNLQKSSHALSVSFLFKKKLIWFHG